MQWNDIYVWYDSHGPEDKIILYFIVISVLLSTGILTTIFISRARSNYIEVIKNFYENKYVDFLTELVFSEDYNINSREYKEMLTSYNRYVLPISLKRNILIKVILEMESNLIGEGSDRLRELYFALRLERYAKRELKARRWDKKVAAIRILAQMDIRDSFKDILKYNTSKIELLRAEAQYACVKLVGIEAIKLITETPLVISEWQQIQILEFIKKKGEKKVPNFSSLLSSENDSVVLFGLKLVAYFKQMDASTNLLILLNHRNDLVVQKAIECLSILEVKDVVKHLKVKYPNASYDCRLEILKSIGNLGDNRDIDFLRKGFREEYHDIKMAAAKAMRKISKKGEQMMASFTDYSNEMENAIIAHAFDDRI